MKSSKPTQGNPLGMQQLGPDGIYVLPLQHCSLRRREFFVRANRILGSYTVIAIYSNQGRLWGESQASAGTFGETTPMRLKVNGRAMQTSYRKIKEMYQRGLPQLVNYMFLMIYGNFESFLSDLICDALSKQGHLNPEEETVHLMMASKWAGKIDRLSERFGLDLGKQIRSIRFQNLPMGFAGNTYKDPIDFLQAIAEIRHRLIHYSSRVDALFKKAFPKSGVSEGDLIILPAEFPYDAHYYFVMLTDIIDEAFSKQFAWPRNPVPPEQLVD